MAATTATTAAAVAKQLTNLEILRHFLQYNGVKFGVSSIANVIFEHQKLRPALKSFGINVGLDTGANFLAFKIGQARAPQLKLKTWDFAPYIFHKFQHGALGFTRGMLNGLLQGRKGSELYAESFGGCIGATVAEVIAESLYTGIQERMERNRVENAHLPEKQREEALSNAFTQETEKVKLFAQLGSVNKII